MCDIMVVQHKLGGAYIPDAFLGLFLTRDRGGITLLCGLLLCPLLYCRTGTPDLQKQPLTSL